MTSRHETSPYKTPRTVSEPLTVRVEEAARLLGISRGSAYALAARGELPGALRLGGRIVVSRAALERALAGEAVASP
jgi:excisionase family DNA binding protein